MSAGRPREVVLIGGGHAHVHVLEGFAAHPVPGSCLKVVADTSIAVYSGMVPGFVAGQYRTQDLQIDVRALARRARAEVIVARATGIDTSRCRIALQDNSPVHYDIACFDIGSTAVPLADETRPSGSSRIRTARDPTSGVRKRHLRRRTLCVPTAIAAAGAAALRANTGDSFCRALDE